MVVRKLGDENDRSYDRPFLAELLYSKNLLELFLNQKRVSGSKLKISFGNSSRPMK